MRAPATIIASIALFGSSLAVPSTPSSAESADSGPMVDVAFKALADGAVVIDPASVGADSTVAIVEVEAGSTDLALSLIGPGLRTASVPVGPTAGPVRVELPGVTTSDEGSVRVVLSGTASDGSELLAVDEVWFDTVGDRNFVSEVGVEDLEFQVHEALGLPVPGPMVAIDDLRLDVPRATVVEKPGDGTCSTGRVCASGTARWTDRTGATHPVRSAYVDLVEIVSGDEIVRSTVLTDDTGRYEADFATSGPADVVVQLRAAGPGFNFLFERGGGSQSRAKFSGVRRGVAPGKAITEPFVMGAVAAEDTVFSLHAAMTYAVEYLPTLRSTPFPDVGIVFPARGTFYDPGSETVSMLELDRWDWDVMLHEFGHFVAGELGIEDHPGGGHSGSENLGDRLPKDQANKLAWGEGWPTYFAVSTLLEGDAADLGIETIGDTSYQDTEDTSISDDLEKSARLGEDNEITVSNVLWDLYDEPVDGADRTVFGTRGVWDVLDPGDPVTLSEAMALFTPDDGARTNDVNCVLGQANVSPQLSGPAEQAMPAASPGLSWIRGNGGGTGRNDRFVVEYRNADSTVVLFSATTSDTSYRVPMVEWDRLAALSGGAIQVSVLGSATARLPVTGPYRSCARTFVTDVAPVVDDVIVPLTPARFLDTRPGERTFDGVGAGEGRRRGGEVARVRIAGRGTVGDRARAAVVNLTAVNPGGGGFVTAFDCSAPMPPSSSLNYVAATDIANEIIVSLSDTGDACFFTEVDTDLVVDVVGYLEPASPLAMVSPARLLDTRSIESGTVDGESADIGRLGADSQVSVRVVGRAGVADDAVAAVLNVAAVDPDRIGYVTVYPCGSVRPLASSLNVVPGVDRANEIIAPLDDSGNVCLYTSGGAHAIIDVVAYVPAGSGYVPMTPVRFVDTRLGQSKFVDDGGDPAPGRQRDGDTLEVQITGRAGIPADATAVTAYVTAVFPDTSGFVTVWPCDEPRPLSSSLNLIPLVDGGNELVARLDGAGRICVFTRGSADITVDVAGYLGGYIGG